MAIQMDFSNDDYKNAIDRELSKRLTTYPRIILKSQKKGLTDEEIKAIQHEQNIQIYNLQNIRFCIEQSFIPSEPTILDSMINELKREFKMRKKCYPRWVWFHQKSSGKSGISQETATFELAIWKSLILHFENHVKNGTHV